MTVQGRFCWYELMTRGSQAAIDFYTRVIGWKAERWPGPMDYTMFSNGSGTLAGVVDMTGQQGTEQVPCHWLGYIGVDDLEATTLQALGLGATKTHGPMDIPTVGKMTFFSDPQGAAFAMFQPETPGEERSELAPMGGVAWHGLSTNDPAAAWGFYSELFGWVVTQDMDMGPGGPYRMFATKTMPTKSVGGLGQLPPGGEMPSNWSFYFRVQNTPETVEVARAAGATLVMGPMDVPGNDVIAVMVDPQGCHFSVVADKG